MVAVGLDFVVAEARRCGIRLILSLANNYESFGGKKQYVNWGRSRGQYLTSDDDFFTNSMVKGLYKNHISSVLNRYNAFTGVIYKNDPTIMAWELMNEPRCTSDPSGRTIQAWIMEMMASYLKSVDRNHLVEAGLEGFFGPSSPQRSRLNPVSNIGTGFIANNMVPVVDFATVHSYPDQWLSNTNDQNQVSFMSKWLDTHIQDAERVLRKPILIAEFGKSWRDMFSGGAAGGGLFWQLLAPGMDNFGDGYEIILSDKRQSSTANLIAQQALINCTRSESGFGEASKGDTSTTDY
ncbi:mannan endo-1,4-beta-mannosidase 7-like [Salvia splendens]|nr:mannan endo-1,4-beta-mannosidase 7-like [Salvia splendens]